MISCDYTRLGSLFKTIRNFLLNKAFLFLAILLSIIIAGCSTPNPVQLTAAEEYEAQKKLVQLQSDVDNEDYMGTQFILSGFQKDFSGTNFYKKHSKRINELAKKIKKNTQDIKSEDKIEYLFIPPRLETTLWKEYMSAAERIISQNHGRIGVTVLRVILEDENVEHPSVRVDWNSNNELNIYSRGGYSSGSSFQSGDAVFIGSEFRRYNASDSNDKAVLTAGDIIIGGIYHYPTKLKIKVQKGKAVAFGEIFVRSIPEKYRGNLMVKVEAEEGLKLTDAGVTLKACGFYPGKTEPVKEGSCLFGSVGPGEYSVELAQNGTFGSPYQSAVVVLGQTTEVTINAYRHRRIELDWRFRKTKEPNNWLSGRKIIKTKEYWQPDEEWVDVHYPAVEFGDWIDNTCKIRTYNGNLMYVDTNEPFEKMSFPLNFSSASYNGCPIKQGDVFAWRREEQKEGFLEALIRIRKITPIERPDVPKFASNLPDNTILAEVLGQKVYLRDIEPASDVKKKYQESKTDEQFNLWLKQTRTSNLSRYFKPLLDEYVKEKGLTVTEQEINEFKEKMISFMTSENKKMKARRDSLAKELGAENIGDSKKTELEKKLNLYNRLIEGSPEPNLLYYNTDSNTAKLVNDATKSLILNWKTNKELYKQYKGRVVQGFFQQAGPNPLDAFRIFFEEQQSKGNFKFYNKDTEDLFWDYYRNVKHNFCKDPNEAEQLINTQWWLKEKEEDYYDTEAEWGDEVNGFQIRIKERGRGERIFYSDKVPTFKMDLLNTSDKTFACASLEQFCEVEGDGKWYKWAGPEVVDIFSAGFGPKKVQYDFLEIKLTENWVLKESSPQENKSQPLSLSLGNHIVRVKYKTMYTPEGPETEAVSNSLKFKIIPPGPKSSVSEPNSVASKKPTP
jgi:hypothetical protein